MTESEQLAAKLASATVEDAWSPVFAAAKDANAADRAAAKPRVWPTTIEGMTSATRQAALTVWLWMIGRITGPYSPGLAQVHARVLASDPDVALLCRTIEALADVHESGARTGQPTSDRETWAAATARAGAAAVAAYQREIERQLAAIDGELGGAARVLVRCDELDARLDAERQRLEQAAAAEVARIEQEQRESARTVAAEAKRRLAEAQAAAIATARTAAEAQQTMRRLRAEALVARLAASGLKSLRVGSVDAGRLYGVPDLIKTAPSMSLEQIDAFTRALDRAGA